MHPRLVVSTHKLTLSCTEVLPGGCDVERPSPSERATLVRCDDDRESIRNGVGVDGKR